MAAMIVRYGEPNNGAAFEKHYANKHIAYAAEYMPHVAGAPNLRVLATRPGPHPWRS